jgi:tetratricopeptide (TPR) repeat protein
MTRPVDTRAALAAAQADIAAGKYKDALQHCKVALRADKSNTSTLILIGKAALGLEEFEQAELAYRRALESKPDLLSAWEGLALVHAAAGNTVGEVEANERLVSGANWELKPSVWNDNNSTTCS